MHIPNMFVYTLYAHTLTSEVLLFWECLTAKLRATKKHTKLSHDTFDYHSTHRKTRAEQVHNVHSAHTHMHTHIYVRMHTCTHPQPPIHPHTLTDTRRHACTHTESPPLALTKLLNCASQSLVNTAAQWSWLHRLGRHQCGRCPPNSLRL